MFCSEDLPSDPYAASVELLRRVNERFIDERNDSTAEAQYSTATGILAAFYDANHFEVPKPVESKSGNGVEDLIHWHRSIPRRLYEAFHNEIMQFQALHVRSVAKKAISSNIRKAFGYAVLTGEEKEKIHSSTPVAARDRQSPQDRGRASARSVSANAADCCPDCHTGSRRRAPACHGDVLQSRGFDLYLREARR